MTQVDKLFFRSWAEFETYLEDLGLFRMQPGLERMKVVLERLNLKRPPYLLTQGVGTNGKGSTCSFLASLARSHGFTCGLHTSPHFLSVRERIRLFRSPDSELMTAPNAAHRGGELFSEADWLAAANEILNHGGEILTYFELITCLAALLFKKAGVDLAVMESGLGGSFDATSAFEADLVFFTPIAMDHAGILGPTLSDIARDKAGAIRPGVAAFSARQVPPVTLELQNMAEQRGAELIFCAACHELPKPDFQLGLAGQHQYGNAGLALLVWRELYRRLQANSINSDKFNPIEITLNKREAHGLAQAWLPGRLQMVDGEVCGVAVQSGATAPGLSGATAPGHPPLIPGGVLKHPPLILDGAHNAHGMSALGHSLALLGIAPAVTIFSCLADKEPEKIIPHLRILSPGLILVPELPDQPRAMPAKELAALVGRPARAVANLAEAIEIAGASMTERLPEIAGQSIQECRYPLLICGSLYLLAEFYKLYPHCLLGGAVTR
ncbi:MAG: bifunctional folylpolyglutamate synthase/dihydrofolate synthase [Deltaproteobacteria bacterium]|jgi:dihydrofolate synthase/folylpolyglutamate synthase|nr:bifunctional folylpolyglutamate synthase/dihydrofolate synthase [Deltaproteobacteria bacterium]